MKQFATTLQQNNIEANIDSSRQPNLDMLFLVHNITRQVLVALTITIMIRWTSNTMMTADRDRPYIIHFSHQKTRAVAATDPIL